MEADAQAMNDLKNREEAAKYRDDMEKKSAQAAAGLLTGKTLKLTAKAGQGRKAVWFRHHQGGGGGAEKAVRSGY